MIKPTRGGVRKGAGRKRILENKKTTAFSLTESLHARLAQWAEDHGIPSLSEAVRELIKRHC